MKRKVISAFVLTATLTLPMSSHAAMFVYDPTAAYNFLLLVKQWAVELIWHTQTDAVTMLANMKSNLMNKTVSEGIAEWQVNEELRRENIRIQHSLEQPETTCATMSHATNTLTSDTNVAMATHAAVADRAIKGRRLAPSAPGGTSREPIPITANENSTNQIIKTYDYVVSNFCTPAEAKAGRCQGVDASAVKYPGGDIRGDLLFGDGSGPDGSGNGSLTISTEQNVAVEAFISNIVDGMSPEILRNPAWEKTEAGRKYVLMVRQYAAFMSLTSNSLHSIQQNHAIDKNLGMSKMEAADRFVKLKWSKESIQDLATATEPHKILREIAQQNAYRLWFEFQQLTASERQEALLAGQLALMSNQFFTPALAAQKSNAVNRGNSAGS